jgi:hypothetical protein
VRRLLGYCPQFDSLLELLTVKEHLELFARIKGVPERDLGAVVRQKVAELDLGAFVPGPPHQAPFGAEAWLLDPEDNRLLLLMLPFGSSKADETPPAADSSV